MKNKTWLFALIAIVVVAIVVAVVIGVNSKNKTEEGLEITFIDAEKGDEADDEILDGTDAVRGNGSGETGVSAITDNGNSSLVGYKKISPNKTSPRNHTIDTITIHTAGGPFSVAKMGEVFAKEQNKASANYGIDHRGEIGLYVEEKDRAWSSGSRENDNRAINIEVSSESTSPYKVSKAAYNALISLLTDICKRNGIKKLVWNEDSNARKNHLDGANMTLHTDFMPNKGCPGEYLKGKMPEIANAVNKKLGAN